MINPIETIDIKATQRRKIEQEMLKRMENFPDQYKEDQYIFSFNGRKVGYLVITDRELFWTDKIREIQL